MSCQQAAYQWDRKEHRRSDRHRPELPDLDILDKALGVQANEPYGERSMWAHGHHARLLRIQSTGREAQMSGHARQLHHDVKP